MAEYIIRWANSGDLTAIEELLADSGLPTVGVGANVDQFLVADSRDGVIGVLGRQVEGRQALLRSFAVRTVWQKGGIGLALVQHMLDNLQRQKCKDAFLLTETAEAYFQRIGFVPATRDAISKTLLVESGLDKACPCSSRCLQWAF